MAAGGFFGVMVRQRAVTFLSFVPELPIRIIGFDELEETRFGLLIL